MLPREVSAKGLEMTPHAAAAAHGAGTAATLLQAAAATAGAITVHFFVLEHVRAGFGSL
jgi:hypothetical protein